MVGLYKYFSLYERDGCSRQFLRLIDEQFDEYDAVELAYWQSVIEAELSWRLGSRADYLREVQLIVLARLQRQRDLAQMATDDTVEE